MHDSVDQGLTRLAALRAPAALDAVEAEVFAAIDDQARQRQAGRTVGMWSVGAALALGLAGGTSLAGEVAATPAASPIGVEGTLAPSTLLLGR